MYLYKRDTIRKIAACLQSFYMSVLENPGTMLADIDIIFGTGTCSMQFRDSRERKRDTQSAGYYKDK
jgi:hypothetical protein